MDVLNSLNSLNSTNEFNKIYKQNLQELKTSGDSTDVFKLGISKTEIINDPELASDLKILSEKNNQAVNGLDSSDMSADKSVKGFSEIIGNYIKDVNNKQINADSAINTFTTGGNIDVHNVMIASEKANLSMQLALQLRNKCLQAYQEISRMPL